MASSTITQTSTIVKQPKNDVTKKEYPTLEELRKAIPAECFEKDALKSIFFLVWDLLCLAGMYMIVGYVENYFGWIGLLSWYFVFGMFGFSLFVVGHDCGHTTFSNYTWLNDICGHIAHAPIMAPYWPWQKSHRQHHQYTSHFDKDRGHVWIDKERYDGLDYLSKQFHKFPPSGLIFWHLYTFAGIADGSHFWPWSRLFTNTKERIQCAVSALAVFGCMYASFVFLDYSVFNWIKYYYIPCCFAGYWLVIVTYLQHRDESVEVYEEGSWNYVKGQLQTYDRYYGFGIDYLMHHITDCHVVHHLFFTKIPHYKLKDATKAIKAVLAEYPGTYKYKYSYDFVFEYHRLQPVLEYLIGKGTGMMKYFVSSEVPKTKTE
uniref:FA_desaturase domain-containing protein n=1 Tax=Strongyloides venezuelensis TaxID=75913 RepID=A0A0K0FDF8_STRVS